MRVNSRAYVPTQLAASFVHIESFEHGSDLIISKPDGDGIFVGRSYEMSPLVGGGSEFSGLIQNLFKMMPDDSLVQCSLISPPDHDTPFDLVRGKDFGNEMLAELISRQAALYEKALKIDGLYDLPVINRKTVIFALMVPVKTINDDVLAAALEVQQEFLSGLIACGFVDAHVLSPGALIGVYRQMANMFARRRDAVVDELLDLRSQVYGPDDEFDPRPRDYAVLPGKVYCAAVVPKTLPEEVSHGLMNLVIGAPLNSGTAKEGGGVRIKTPFILSATVRVASQSAEASRVAKAIKSRTKNEKVPFSLGVEDTEQTLKDLKYLEQTCTNTGNKYTYANITAFVFSTDKNEILSARNNFKTIMNNLDFDARDVVGTVGVRFAQALPLNFSVSIANKLAGEAIMPASSAACLLPIFGDYMGNADPASSRTGCVFITRRGTPHFWDMYQTNSNKNGTLLAKSGAGKSFATQYIIQNEVAQGTRVFLFDNGKSAKKFCQTIEGEFIEFGADDNFRPSLNPYTDLTEEEFDEQAETITALVIKMAYYKEEVESGARIAASEAVKAAYDQKRGAADINTVIQALEQIKNNQKDNQNVNEVVAAAINMIPRLRNFMENPARGPYFRGKSSLAPKNRFTVFELGSLDGDEHLKQCILFFVMNMLMRTVKDAAGRKLIMLDEAKQLLDDEGSAPVLEGLYRKGRKDDAGIWVISQDPSDLLESAVGRVILGQSHWKLVMQMEAEDTSRMLNNGGLTKFANDPYFHKCIKDVRTVRGKYSEILICGESTYETVRLYVDRFTGTLFSSEGEARTGVFELMRRGMRAVEAVKYLIGEQDSERKTWLKSIVSQLRQENLTDEQIRRELDEVLNG